MLKVTIVIRELQIKNHNGDTTSQPQDSQNKKIQITTHVDGDGEKLDSSYTAGGRVKWPVALENDLAVPQKIKPYSCHVTKKFQS